MWSSSDTRQVLYNHYKVSKLKASGTTVDFAALDYSSTVMKHCFYEPLIVSRYMKWP